MFLKHGSFCIFLIVLSFENAVGGVLVKFMKCGANGFTCSAVKTKNLEVTYQCPSGTDDVIFNINQFNSPANIENLIINNCRKLTVSMRCTGEKKNIQILKIRNIQYLSFQRLQYNSHLPPRVYLENIAYIDTVPSYTFAQIDKSIHTFGCTIPKDDFSFLYLKNVSIDTVQSNAFSMPSNVNEISLTNVVINRLQSSAFRIKLEKSGKFNMERSSIGVMEHLAFQINGKNASFVRNEFVEVASSGINGTMENFRFANNSVNTLQPHALSVLATNVFILHNRFQYLKSGALEKISPGLMEDSGRSFGSLRFVYQFTGNEINFMDAGCLHPDIAAYENVASDMRFDENGIFCSCENSGWLISQLGHGYNTAPLSDFYQTIFETEQANYCSWTCNLPLSTINKMVNVAAVCNSSITMEYLCATKDLTTTAYEATTKLSMVDLAVEEAEIETLAIVNGGSSTDLCPLLFFLHILVYFKILVY